jgi:hypothetical protein
MPRGDLERGSLTIIPIIDRITTVSVDNYCRRRLNATRVDPLDDRKVRRTGRSGRGRRPGSNPMGKAMNQRSRNDGFPEAMPMQRGVWFPGAIATADGRMVRRVEYEEERHA